MQPISGPMSAIGGPASLGGISSIGTTAPSGVSVMGAIGGISSAILGEVVSTSVVSSTLPAGEAALCSQLSGSLGVLMKEEEEKKEPEDWQEELTQRKVSKEQEGTSFMKSIGRKQTTPGKSGLNVPGLQIEAIEQFVQ